MAENKKEITELNCLVCSKLHKKNDFWVDCVVIADYCANYGSGHDGDYFYICICDGCFKEKLMSGGIKLTGNMFYDNADEVEYYEKIQKRNSIIDGIDKNNE